MLAPKLVCQPPKIGALRGHVYFGLHPYIAVTSAVSISAPIRPSGSSLSVSEIRVTLLARRLRFLFELEVWSACWCSAEVRRDSRDHIRGQPTSEIRRM